MQTNEGAFSFDNTGNACLEFFSKAGSLYVGAEHFYDNSNSALELFKEAYKEDQEKSIKLLFWLRDCRGGAGNRSGFRSIIKWLANENPKVLNKNIESIPYYGRWDDLRSLYRTRCHNTAVKLWAEALLKKDILAAKWAKRTDIPIGKRLGFKTEGEMRKYLVSIRKEHIVEDKLTHKQYESINYSHVPSVAMARYTNAFNKHDSVRFKQYKEDVKNGISEIKSQVLFPHDCVRTAMNGDQEIADLQFQNLPNYLENSDERIMVIADSSGSMGIRVSGCIEAVDIAKSLALYCSAKIPEFNIFHKKFIEFSEEGSFRNWNDMSFSNAVHDDELFSEAMGATRIDKALKLILDSAKMYKLGNHQMPTALVIISDMQFHEGTKQYNYSFYGYEKHNHQEEIEPLTEIEKAMKQWDDAGYKRPKIIYWNVAGGYSGSQDTIDSKDIAMISGFSPAILTSIFNGNTITPEEVMNLTIEKYQVSI
jgi:hypothetical protein